MSILNASGTRQAFVCNEGAIVVGVSGHQIARLTGETEVMVHEDFGSYTRVSSQGRTGYILSESLRYGERSSEPDAETAPREAVVQKRNASWVSRTTIGLLLAGGAATALLRLLAE